MRRISQLIPFSRFHKRVLFIGESCKTGGARFTGYPTDIAGRIELLQDFQPLLLTHLENLKQVLEMASGMDSALHAMRKNHSKIQELLVDAIAEDATENDLNSFGLELVSHTRNVERVIFQNLQETASESQLSDMLNLARKAGFYEMH